MKSAHPLLRVQTGREPPRLGCCRRCSVERRARSSTSIPAPTPGSARRRVRSTAESRAPASWTEALGPRRPRGAGPLPARPPRYSRTSTRVAGDRSRFPGQPHSRASTDLIAPTFASGCKSRWNEVGALPAERPLRVTEVAHEPASHFGTGAGTQDGRRPLRRAGGTSRVPHAWCRVMPDAAASGTPISCRAAQRTSGRPTCRRRKGRLDAASRARCRSSRENRRPWLVAGCGDDVRRRTPRLTMVRRELTISRRHSPRPST